MYRILSTVQLRMRSTPYQCRNSDESYKTVCFRWFKDNLDYVDADKNAAIWGWVSIAFYIPENNTVAFEDLLLLLQFTATRKCF